MKHKKGRSLCPVGWNQFKFVKSGIMKTTSSLESWNSKFASIVGVKKPKFNFLINRLKIEQETNETVYQEIQDGRHKVYKNSKTLDRYEIITRAALKPYHAGNFLEHIDNIAKHL